MIALDRPPIAEDCPVCGAPLEPTGWHMPGMRMLARAVCQGCQHPYFVDLPAGQAIHSPMILDPRTGAVFDRTGVTWFADWLRQSFRDRTSGSPPVTFERRAEPTRPIVLVNCLDTLYGHALLKLLNCQQYLDGEAFDVVVMIQPFLAALVPDGVVEVWTVDLPLRDGIRWSDGLAQAIAEHAGRLGGVRLAPVHPHPDPGTFAIERFSRVAPFPVARWQAAPRLAVTFIWREDRRWPPGRFGRPGQARAVASFLAGLRRRLPGLDAAVAGLGTSGGLPDWIADLRSPAPSAGVERAWLERYAASHAVVGVHGSNMLLPSAHAGSTIELLPENRAGNFLQDIVFNGSEPRDLMFRYRFVSARTRPSQLAELVATIVRRYPDFAALMAPSANRDADVRA